MNSENKKIVHVLIALSVLFLALAVYLTWFEVFLSPRYVASSYNRRQQIAEDKVLRGSILDRNGLVLARSVMKKDRQERTYPYGKLYSQVIGYNSRIYGRSLLELSYNSYLLGLDDYSRVLNVFGDSGKEMKSGCNLYTTLDHDIQKLGDKLLNGRKGAIAAMDPKTGEVIALVSKPDFNPDEKSLDSNWKSMTESEDSPFLPRATMGLYAPGSTYKVAIAALAVENGLEDLRFDDKGTVLIDGRTFSNYNKKAYGSIDISKGLAVSSNVVYSQLGVKLGESRLADMAERLGMNRNIPFDLPVSQSTFRYRSMGETDMAAAAIGQGKLMVTPLHMAMIASSIANKGVMMEPRLVSRVSASNGYNVKVSKPSELYRVMKADTAEKVKQMMQIAVEDGTGTKAAIKGVHVAGKTGTAENELSARQKNKEHAWFIGFAPAEDPVIAVAVVLEYGGNSGGSVAAPIAGKIMAEYLKGQK